VKSEVYAEKRGQSHFLGGNETFLAHFLFDGILGVIWGTGKFFEFGSLKSCFHAALGVVFPPALLSIFIMSLLTSVIRLYSSTDHSR
jgi:hypothetical protein